MATTYKEVITKGPVEWARIFEENRDLEGYEGAYSDTEGAYTITQVLDKAEYEKLKKSGSMKKPIQSRMMDGVIAVKFERKHIIKDRAGNVVEKAGGPPKVVGPNGKPWSMEEDGLIGNGSLAELTHLVQGFSVIDKDTGKAKQVARTTLQKVKVLELVKYERQEEEV